jgi:hypothetical protein
MITRLSRQRTERIKHGQTVELEREFLTLAMATYKHALAKGYPTDLVDVMLTLRGTMTGWRNSELQVPDGRIGHSESAPAGITCRTARHSPNMRSTPPPTG